jgi:hypothetical protein
MMFSAWVAELIEAEASVLPATPPPPPMLCARMPTESTPVVVMGAIQTDAG